MYPRNAASPPIIEMGQIVLFSDGTIQTTGASVRVKIGTEPWGAGAGSLDCDATSGVWTYAPTQAETADPFFLVAVYKSGCSAQSRCVITSVSDTAGYAGLDWSKVRAATTTLNLSGTTIKTATDVETDTADIQTRLPAALVSGRIDSSVGAYQAGLAPPSAAENGAAGWNRMLVDHTSTGSFGYVVGLFFQLIENVTGWRFTAKALEQAPTGDVTVNITPAYVSQQAIVDNNKITVRRGSRGWVLLTVTDATTGDPIDLSVYAELKFLVGPAGEATVQTQDVTAFGADNNQFYWKPNEASTLKERQLNWSLFNDIDDTASQYYRAKPADGVINVLESPV